MLIPLCGFATQLRLLCAGGGLARAAPWLGCGMIYAKFALRSVMGGGGQLTALAQPPLLKSAPFLARRSVRSHIEHIREGCMRGSSFETSILKTVLISVLNLSTQ